MGRVHQPHPPRITINTGAARRLCLLLFGGAYIIASEKKMGRKGAYEHWITPEGLQQVRQWVIDGYSNKQIADAIGVSVKTMWQWCNRFEDFGKAVRDSRQPVIGKMENALYDICDWHTATEETVEIITRPDGKEERRVKKVTKHIPPNTNALIFALRNLAAEKWKSNPTATDNSGADVFANIAKLMVQANADNAVKQ